MNKLKQGLIAGLLVVGFTKNAHADNERFDFDAFNPTFQEVEGMASPGTVNYNNDVGYGWFDMEVLMYNISMAIKMSSTVILPQGTSKEDYVKDLTDALAIVETLIDQGDRFIELNSRTPILSQLLGYIGDQDRIPLKAIPQKQNIFENISLPSVDT